jgi:hypothetical protein
MSAQTTRLLDAAELGERWGVPKSMPYRLSREGKLETVHIGKYKRWRIEVIEQFEREGGADCA